MMGFETCDSLGTKPLFPSSPPFLADQGHALGFRTKKDDKWSLSSRWNSFWESEPCF